MYKGALFFDYDGTLIDRRENIFKPTPKTIEALEAAQAKGYLVCLATGRSLSYMPETGINFDCVITDNGGYVVYKNQELLRNPFDKTLLKEMFEYFNKNNIVCVSENENNCYVNFYDDENFLEKIHAFNLEQSQFKPYNGEDEDIYKLFLIYHHHEEFEEFYKLFGSRVSATLPHLGLTSCDVNPPGVTKADGIKAIVEHFGLSYENTYAFGDGGNDIDMLNAVKHSVVMGDHSALLDNMGEFVTDTVKNEGIYKSFVHYGLIEE